MGWHWQGTLPSRRVPDPQLWDPARGDTSKAMCVCITVYINIIFPKNFCLSGKLGQGSCEKRAGLLRFPSLPPDGQAAGWAL